MQSDRVQELNKQKVFRNGRFALYIMRNLRTRFSPGLAFAAQCANAINVPLVAAFVYVPARHNAAQKVFLLEGLLETRRSLSSMGCSLLALRVNDENEAARTLSTLFPKISEVITDAAYLREERSFEDKIAELLVHAERRATKVESNLVVPVTLVSDDVEHSARTIRSKIWQHVNDMLKERWEDTPSVKCLDLKRLMPSPLDEMDIESELESARAECHSDSGLTGGEDSASRMLEYFLNNKIQHYETKRNVPGNKYQSTLSPYLHFGMISPVEVLRRTQDSRNSKASKDAFIEELLIRRELSFNLVYYSPDEYDTLHCLPDWAKITMRDHLSDKRTPLYTAKELEDGLTYDPYWNACQLEMVHTNKMHGYMRMYWAKKVIQWTEDYKTAFAFLVEQNNKHELDGNDPNGYAGILWNFGMHDRAHAERAVFGKLRYMNSAGLVRKFKGPLEKYVEANYALANRTPDFKAADAFPEPERTTRKRKASL